MKSRAIVAKLVIIVGSCSWYVCTTIYFTAGTLVDIMGNIGSPITCVPCQNFTMIPGGIASRLVNYGDRYLYAQCIVYLPTFGLHLW